MKNLVPIVVSLIGVFVLTTAFTITSKNYFEIGHKKWNLESAIIANESYEVNSKFDLDLISDGKEFSDAKTYIWLSLTSSNTSKVADGLYEFSSKPLSNREPFHFNGSVFINEMEIKIVNGTFTVETLKDNVSVHMIFKLANGNILNGEYNNKFSAEDRSMK